MVTQLLWKRKLLSVGFGCWGNYLQGGLSTGGTVNGGSYTWSVREGTIYGGEGGYPWYVIKLWTRKVSNQNNKNKSIRFLSQYKKWLPPKQVFATAACQTNKLINILISNTESILTFIEWRWHLPAPSSSSGLIRQRAWLLWNIRVLTTWFWVCP